MQTLPKPDSADTLCLLQQENACLKEMVQELTQAVVTAEAANRGKSDFLCNMSHELRTPLHAIKSFAHLLLKRSVTLMQGLAEVADQDVRLYLSEVLHLDQDEWMKQPHFWLLRINENQTRQLELVNKLLDLVGLESGKQSFYFREADLLWIVRSCVDELDALFKEKSVHVSIVSGLERAMIDLDCTQIRSMIINILSNALKFTDTGGEIILKIEEEWRNGVPTLVLQVRDRGQGILEQDLEMIFEPFVQSTQPRDTTKSSGLGLAICRRIVMAHGGTIVASNHPNGGALFTVLLPINCDKPQFGELVPCAS